jgi:hypothetical protein
MIFYNLRSNSRMYGLRNRVILYNFKRSLTNLNKNLYIHSRYQTKNWRKNQDWYNTGKGNECELYQRNLIEKITNQKCDKTNLRINMEDYSLKSKKNPFSQKNGFEWTEDFDDIQEKDNKILHYNLKMVCDNGGSQTRTLREVYHFIKCQLENLLKYNKKNSNKYFINILDGDQSYKRKQNFDYLTNLKRYESISDKVFVGDIKSFDKWYNKLF